MTLATAATASDGKPSKATGLWFGTIFFAAEPDPAALKLQMALVLHADMALCSSTVFHAPSPRVIYENATA